MPLFDNGQIEHRHESALSVNKEKALLIFNCLFRYDTLLIATLEPDEEGSFRHRSVEV